MTKRKQRSPWYCETPEEFESAVEAAKAIADPHEREYQLRQLSIYNGVSLKHLYQPPKAKTRIKGYKIIQQFGEWYVVSSGILHAPMNYLIDKTRLNEADWVEHIRAKTWSNHSEFMAAYQFALQHWQG
jgi:hypothetical protein